MAEYKYKWNDDLVIGAIEKYRSQNASKPIRLIFKGVCYFAMLALLALCIYAGVWFIGIVPLIFIVLLALGPRLDYWLLKKRIRKSPFYDNSLVVKITDGGFECTSDKSKTSLSWAAFSKGRRFPDGFLLFSGVNELFWWADDALSSGTIEEVDILLKANLADYKNV